MGYATNEGLSWVAAFQGEHLCVSFSTSEWLPVPTRVIHSPEKMSELCYLTNSMGVQPNLLA